VVAYRSEGAIMHQSAPVGGRGSIPWT